MERTGLPSPLCQMISRNLVVLLLLCYAILLLLLDTVSHKVTQNIELLLLLSNNNQPHAIIPLLLPITFRCGGGPNTVQIQTWQIRRDTQKGGWASIWLWQECNCGIPLDPRRELQTLLNCHSPPVLLPPDNYTTNPTPSCPNSTTHLLCPEKMDLMIKHIFWRGWGNCAEP
jgi:hypothetical protein